MNRLVVGGVNIMNPLVVGGVIMTIVVILATIMLSKRKSPTAPVQASTCLLTTKTYADGARCDGAGERKTSDWCCSKYGMSKGYKWTI